MNAIVATLGVIFVTILWGSWFQTVKHIKTFPVHAFITLMYGLSVLVVWVSIALFGNFLNTKDIFFEISSNIDVCVIMRYMLWNRNANAFKHCKTYWLNFINIGFRLMRYLRRNHRNDFVFRITERSNDSIADVGSCIVNISYDCLPI